jgi:hypothetical protein
LPAHTAFCSATFAGHGNKLTETDPPGNTTRHACGKFRELASITNPHGFTTMNNNDAETGNLLSERDAPGNAIEGASFLGGPLSAARVVNLGVSVVAETAAARFPTAKPAY